MRIVNHNHIRHIMLYHIEKGWNAAPAFRDLNELFGEGTISISQVKKWFNKFKTGDTNLQMNEEEVNYQISTTGHFWQPW